MEVHEESSRVRADIYQESTKTEDLRSEKDLLEEVREKATIRNANYKQAIKQYHDRRVRQERLFQPGDLVLRRIETTGMHVKKLAPPWEGPFRVTEVMWPGT